MRATAGTLWDLWNSGGPFIGADRAHARVTVQVGWTLATDHGPFDNFDRPPVRWFQSTEGHVETEIPGVRSIDWERSIDIDAATCQIVIANQKANAFGADEPDTDTLWNPGYLTWNRGESPEAQNRWGHQLNEWHDVIVPNALLRTYEGYGGHGKSLSQAVVDGNLWLTGLWLVDEVRIETNGTVTVRCRDMAKLLIDQMIYPPLVPRTDATGRRVYPLQYCKHFEPVAVRTERIPYGTVINRVKIIHGITTDQEGDGYWMVGSDGGVFSYGYLSFYGSASGLPLNKPTIGIARTSLSRGYWLGAEDGGVFAFGDAPFRGSLANVALNAPVIAIERGINNGYYMAAEDGGVFAFGCPYYGGSPSLTGAKVVGMAVRPQGDGYWLLSSTGGVFSFGAAGFYGNTVVPGATEFTSIASTPSGNGYILVTKLGHIYCFGDAVYRGGAQNITLNDPICDITVHPGGDGYWLGAEDGGVFTYGVSGGPVHFYGSLPGPWVTYWPVEGNYVDYADIVKHLLLWAGWYLNDGGTTAEVFGNIESTGIAEETACLPQDMFDKKPVIDPITRIREVVGYLFRIDEDGGAHFESPNFWSPGNFLPNGSHTDVIPHIDEALQITQYAVQRSDQSLRSPITITNNSPDADFTDTVTTTITPAYADDLRGVVRPMVYAHPLLTDRREQRIMAELIAIHIWFRQRLGSVSISGNPMLQIDDQVRIFERQAAETYVHYLRGISSRFDLEAGRYEMTLTTSWLGDDEGWAVVVPSVTVRPATVRSETRINGKASLPRTVSASVRLLPRVPWPMRVGEGSAFPGPSVFPSESLFPSDPS